MIRVRPRTGCALRPILLLYRYIGGWADFIKFFTLIGNRHVLRNRL
jgi:hypothetical protein